MLETARRDPARVVGCGEIQSPVLETKEAVRLQASRGRGPVAVCIWVPGLPGLAFFALWYSSSVKWDDPAFLEGYSER